MEPLTPHSLKHNPHHSPNPSHIPGHIPHASPRRHAYQLPPHKIISDFVNKSPTQLHGKKISVGSPAVLAPVAKPSTSRYANYPVNPVVRTSMPAPPISRPAPPKTTLGGTLQPKLPLQRPLKQHRQPGLAATAQATAAQAPNTLAPTAPPKTNTKRAKKMGLRIGETGAWISAMVIALLVGLFVPLSAATQTVCIAYGILALIIGVQSKYSFGMALLLLVSTMLTQAIGQEDASSSLAVAAFLLLCAGTLGLLRETVLQRPPKSP